MRKTRKGGGGGRRIRERGIRRKTRRGGGGRRRMGRGIRRNTRRGEGKRIIWEEELGGKLEEDEEKEE